MKHYGDITKISGHNVPIVDIVCGGSPCQDLSVAGKREGLSGKRSGLFMEQLRIIKEMREKDAAEKLSMSKPNEYIRPRFMVWENVPGAFSSNKGEDFRIVLEETAKVVERNACIPGPPNKGKWSPSGCIMGNGWSIAWRVHDAQFWGVPQRRKRISLVADFAGGAAPEILFERKGVSGDITESGEPGKDATTDVRSGIEETSRAVSFQERAGKPGGGKGILIQNERTGALSTLNNQSVVYGISSYNSNAMKSSNPHSGIYEAETTRTLDNNGGNPACNQGGMAVVLENHPNDSRVKIREDGKVQTLSSRMGTGGGNVPKCVSYANDAYDKWSESEKGASLRASGGIYGGGSESLAVGSVVRRLTPLECERLQGYPDGWTDIGEWYDSKGKKHKEADSPRYKALGNSIALPFWQWMAERMCKYIENPTMASLFDGIGGFPLVFSRCGCVPVWASEIEEFPIAVTKIRFPEGSECE